MLFFKNLHESQKYQGIILQKSLQIIFVVHIYFWFFNGYFVADLSYVFVMSFQKETQTKNYQSEKESELMKEV